MPIVAKFLSVVFVLVIASSCSDSSTPPEIIGVQFPYQSRFIDVHGSKMHYIDEGDSSGDVILLLHGNPTSIYSWRNVIPHLLPTARVIAVDLIGMGKSEKPDIGYGFLDHALYLEEFIQLMELRDISIVGHDWGSGLMFHYATRHQDNVRGLAFMEAVLDVDYWENHSELYKEILTFLRSDAGLVEIIENNVIVDPGIQDDVIRQMSEVELDQYRTPFINPEDRYLTWKWVTEIPIDGEPAAMAELVSTYNTLLVSWDLPMLLLYGEPGGEYPPEVAEGFANLLQDATAVSVGAAKHYIMEDQPHRIGRAISSWHSELPESSTR